MKNVYIVTIRFAERGPLKGNRTTIFRVSPNFEDSLKAVAEIEVKGLWMSKYKDLRVDICKHGYNENGGFGWLVRYFEPKEGRLVSCVKDSFTIGSIAKWNKACRDSRTKTETEREIY